MSANPYSPPGAHVAEIHSTTEFQEPSALSARGRIGRLRFLVYTNAAILALYVVMIIVTVMAVGGTALATSLTDPTALLVALGGSAALIGLLFAAVFLGFMVFYFMKVVQRSHDMGWSGWTALLTLLPLVIFIWYIVPGNKRTNTYGPQPTPNSTVVKIFGGILIGIMVLSIGLGVLGAVAGIGG
ncbi:MAG: DUF805 domain-containing protein [Pseudomonadota bacterium]